MAFSRNYHKLLGVAENATQTDIRQTYKWFSSRLSKAALLAQGSVAPSAKAEAKDQNELDEAYAALHTPLKSATTEVKSATTEVKSATTEVKSATTDNNVPQFDFNEFLNNPCTTTTTSDEFKTLILNNLQRIQASVRNFGEICEIAQMYKVRFGKPLEIEFIIKNFDHVWLADLDDWNHTPPITLLGNFLRVISFDEWEQFFDFMGDKLRLKIQETLNLANILPTPPFKDRQDLQCVFFDFLTRDWLREKFDNVSKLLSFFEKIPSYNYWPFLIYLNGKDNWIQTKLIRGGTDLGILFSGFAQRIIPEKTQPPSSTRRHLSAEEKHQHNTLFMFDKFLDLFFPKGFIQKLFSEKPYEFTACLKEINKDANPVFNPKETDTLALFLTRCLPPKAKSYNPMAQKITTLEDLMNVLNTEAPLSADEDKSQNNHPYLSEAQSIQFVQSLPGIQEKVFLNHNVDTALTAIQPHKDKPFYRALIYAIAKAYLESEENHSRKEATKSLIYFILSNQPVGADWDVILAGSVNSADGFGKPIGNHRVYLYRCKKFLSENDQKIYYCIEQNNPIYLNDTFPKVIFGDKEKKCEDTSLRALVLYLTKESRKPVNTAGIHQGELGKITRCYTPSFIDRTMTSGFNLLKALTHKGGTGTQGLITYAEEKKKDDGVKPLAQQEARANSSGDHHEQKQPQQPTPAPTESPVAAPQTEAAQQIPKQKTFWEKYKKTILLTIGGIIVVAGTIFGLGIGGILGGTAFVAGSGAAAFFSAGGAAFPALGGLITGVTGAGATAVAALSVLVGGLALGNTVLRSIAWGCHGIYKSCCGNKENLDPPPVIQNKAVPSSPTSSPTTSFMSTALSETEAAKSREEKRKEFEQREEARLRSVEASFPPQTEVNSHQTVAKDPNKNTNDQTVAEDPNKNKNVVSRTEARPGS